MKNIGISWRTVVITLVMMMAAVAVAAPAVAARKDVAGERFNLFGAAPVAGEPFHIAHGFTLTPGEKDGPCEDPGRWDFVLLINGEPVAHEGRIVSKNDVSSDDDCAMSVARVYNFWDGLTGSVEFTGIWSQSCATSTSECDPGDAPGALYETLRIDRSVNFDS